VSEFIRRRLEEGDADSLRVVLSLDPANMEARAKLGASIR
jgi:hypothetical protein